MIKIMYRLYRLVFPSLYRVKLTVHEVDKLSSDSSHHHHHIMLCYADAMLCSATIGCSRTSMDWSTRTPYRTSRSHRRSVESIRASN